MDRHSITVLVPTYQRAGMLRYCLESIALQSRIDLIKEVVVSENGPADESEFVSYSFRDRLPIRYIRQRPTVPAYTHVAKLANEVQTKYVAMLADDDMWSRYHLEESMRCFERYPSIHAYFGQAVYVENETCHTLWKYSNSFLQVPDSAQSSLEDFRIWSSEDAATNCVATTPLNIWALVALTESHQKALEQSIAHPQYGQYGSADRLYIWSMSLQGAIGISRYVSLYYRYHPSSEAQAMFREERQRTLERDLEISDLIADQASYYGFDAYARWRQEYRRAMEKGFNPDRFDCWNPLLKARLHDETIPELKAPDSPSPGSPTSLANKLKYLRYLLTPPIAEKLFTAGSK